MCWGGILGAEVVILGESAIFSENDPEPLPGIDKYLTISF
ncbi:Uncharacterized protein dnm_091370 [Desulfonema magnum]|uniref:Uncharacterized protein n=1 Tax=Desulfonema magnum TaxID=45655 RepID=A0A975GTJ5_9BACT|nr:Uncharacterized protein dnm_091370 [Desulfonema magnum]